MPHAARHNAAHCAAIAAQLPLPDSFTLATFLQQLALQREKPIDLRIVPTDTDSPCGLLVQTTKHDVIFVEQDTTLLHQEHIVLHEVGHLVCGHLGAPTADSKVAELLLPDLPASTVQRVLGRTVFSDHEEHEAELVASLYLHRAGRAPSPLPKRPIRSDDDITSKLASVFDQPRRWGQS